MVMATANAEYWDVLPADQTEANAPARLLEFLDKAGAAARYCQARLSTIFS